MVGSGGGGDAFEGNWFLGIVSCEGIEPGEASFLCVRKRVVSACCRSETRVKGVVWGRWRCASLMVAFFGIGKVRERDRGAKIRFNGSLWVECVFLGVVRSMG